MTRRRSRRTWRRSAPDATVSLPGVPQIVTRLQQMLSDPDVGIPQLVPVINYEPVLVGRVLQMANSAALNPDAPQVTDLRTAVTRVGFDLLRSASLAYALRQVSQAHSVKDIRPHLEALWERSAWTAAVSFVIARKFTKVNRDLAFLGGLMHGVGKLFILTRAAHYPFVLRDRTKYGAILRKWHAPFAQGNPHRLAASIARSSKPSRSTRTSIAKWWATSRISPTSSRPAISWSATPAACRTCR